MSVVRGPPAPQPLNPRTPCRPRRSRARPVEALVADGPRVDRRRRRRHRPDSACPKARASRSTAAPVAPDAHAYVLLHKPADVVTTVRDTHGRRTVVELVGADRRLFPIGRLDADTTGLLLLTNDGELAARLMHPRHGVEKTYEATVRGAVGPETAASAGRRASSWTGGARRRRACACCARRAGRASSRSCCTRAASARCGACARRSATTCSRCTARPTPACGSARWRRAPRGRCARPSSSCCAAPRREGRGRDAPQPLPRAGRPGHAPGRRGARARRPRGRRRRRRAGAVGGGRTRCDASRSTASPSSTHGQAGVLVALVGGERARARPSERAAPGRDLAGRRLAVLLSDERLARRLRASATTRAASAERTRGRALPAARCRRAGRGARPGAQPRSVRAHAHVTGSRNASGA